MTHERIGAGGARDYVAYLLRLWRERCGESTQWRASLQDPHSGEKIGFGGLEDLFVYLRRETVDQQERNRETAGDRREGR